MGDAMKKVRSGERLRIPARTFNSFLDAARDFEARQRNQEQDPKRRFASSGIVLVKNASGADRDRFDVLGVAAPVFTPAENEESFKNQPALVGIVPTEDDHAGRFIILLEPAKAGAIVRGLVAGVSPVHVDVQDEDHGFADVEDGVTDYLRSADQIAAEILWKESGTGLVWALVKIGTSAPAVGWAKAQANWEPNSGDPRVSCKRCTGRDGSGEAGEAFWVYLWTSGGQDPNVRAGQVIPYAVIDDEAVCVSDTGDGIVGKSIELWMGDPALLATERPGWSILTVIEGNNIEGRVPVTYKEGDGRFGAVGATGGSWDHIHPVESQYLAIKEGTGTTKYAVQGVDDYTGTEKEPTWPSCCTPEDTDPVEWFVVALICRSD